MEDQENNGPLVYEILALGESEDFAAITKSIAKHGGTLLSEKPIQKIKLAYPINKQLFCFSRTFVFSILPKALKPFSEELRLTTAILRFSIQHMHIPQKDERRFEKPAQRRGGSRVLRKPVEVALTNEALERKIEEILQ